MRSPAWCLVAAAASSLALLVEAPAYAGWGADLSRVVVTSLVRQYAGRLIQRSMYQATGRSQSSNGYGQSTYAQPNYGQPASGASQGYEQSAPSYTPHNTSTTHHSHSNGHSTVSATARGSLRYPSDQKFIPPPPPYPTVYPGGSDTSISSLNSKASSRGSELVPPPPPAPSVWNDLEPVSEVSAKPVVAQTNASVPKKLAKPAIEAEAETATTVPKAAPDRHHASQAKLHFQNESGT